MKLTTRTRRGVELPGLRGTARADRRTASLLPRLRSGDIAVLDHHDLDRTTAHALVDAGVVAVLNARPMLSGRFPALGPQVLLDAGIPVIDSLGEDLHLRIRDGAALRLDEDQVWAGDDLVAEGRELSAEALAADADRARVGLVAQLESFTHNSTEFLRREQDLLLHGRGVPRLETDCADRPAVIVTPGADAVEELRAIRRFLAETDPVLIGVDRGADLLVAAGHRPEIVVLDAAGSDDDLPELKVLRRSKDVVVRSDRGATQTMERFERLGLRPARFESAAGTEDAALLLAHTHGASVIVGVGAHASLEDFLDRQRPGLASTYLTRLSVGDRLVDARSVPQLYSGRVRPWQLLLVLLAGLIALLAAISVTPVGQQWWDALRAHLDDLLSWLRDLPDTIGGLL